MRIRIPRPKLGRPKSSDVTSGVVTGLFSIPEGMAYASIAGFNPVSGLYAGVVPPILGSLTAPTVLMITTLTSAIALTGQSALADAGLDPHDAGNVAALTVLVGVIMILMGVLRLGVVLAFVSNAVMVGFSTGIALQIITGVLKDATGYKPQGHNKLTQLADWLVHAGDWKLSATLVAAATVAVWALTRAVKRLEPVALLTAMVAVSAAVAVLGAALVVQDGDLAGRQLVGDGRGRPLSGGVVACEGGEAGTTGGLGAVQQEREDGADDDGALERKLGGASSPNSPHSAPACPTPRAPATPSSSSRSAPPPTSPPPPSSRRSAATPTPSTPKAAASSSPAPTPPSSPSCAAPASPTTSTPTPSSPPKARSSPRSTAPTPRHGSGSPPGAPHTADPEAIRGSPPANHPGQEPVPQRASGGREQRTTTESKRQREVAAKKRHPISVSTGQGLHGGPIRVIPKLGARVRFSSPAPRLSGRRWKSFGGRRESPSRDWRSRGHAPPRRVMHPVVHG
ncbi:SulP family inorganic anion transporter [Streptomyces anulatus]